MARVVKRQRYENEQPDYTDEYVIAYRLEDDGTYTIHAVERPSDPIQNNDEAHIDLKGTLVCVAKGKEPRSLERAEAVAFAWMLGYSVYVRTGKSPRGGFRVNV